MKTRHFFDICFLKGNKKTFLLAQKIFSTNQNVFLSPIKKQKKNWLVYITNHVTYFWTD